MDTFRYISYAQEILFGAGSLDRLGEAVGRFGWHRLMLCTSPSQRASGRVEVLAAVLGRRLVAIYDRVLPHVHATQVDEVVADAVNAQVDAFIGMGGGSSIGIAKAAAFAIEERTGRPPRPTPPTAQPLVAVIAIPTTYAGSEMTAVCGVTHAAENPPRKVTQSDPRIAPKLVVYDPRLTLDLPPPITASTGINALAHCVEALYSITRNPLSTAAAVSGARHIFHALPRCFRDGHDLEARSVMLQGAHLAGLALASVKMGLHHGLCHVLGGSAQVPHGIANSILLPHVLRFNASAAAEQLLPLAEAVEVAVDMHCPAEAVERAAERIAGLSAEMSLPLRLRDAGVPAAALPQLAQLGYENQTVHQNPRPIESAAQIAEILRAAW